MPEQDDSDAIAAHHDRQDRVLAIAISSAALVITLLAGILVVVGGR